MNILDNFLNKKYSSVISIMKAGNELCTEVYKYCPISLLIVDGKFLEKLLIDIIYYHVFANALLNGNQFGLFPQKKNTIYAALAAKEFPFKNFKRKKCVILVSFYIRGAFDA